MRILARTGTRVAVPLLFRLLQRNLAPATICHIPGGDVPPLAPAVASVAPQHLDARS